MKRKNQVMRNASNVLALAYDIRAKFPNMEGKFISAKDFAKLCSDNGKVSPSKARKVLVAANLCRTESTGLGTRTYPTSILMDNSNDALLYGQVCNAYVTLTSQT